MPVLPDNTEPFDEYARLFSPIERNSTQQASQLDDNPAAATPTPGLLYTSHGAAQVLEPRGRLMNMNNIETMSSQELNEL